MRKIMDFVKNYKWLCIFAFIVTPIIIYCQYQRYYHLEEMIGLDSGEDI